jgi:hypothetical protein
VLGLIVALWRKRHAIGFEDARRSIAATDNAPRAELCARADDGEANRLGTLVLQYDLLTESTTKLAGAPRVGRSRRASTRTPISVSQVSADIVMILAGAGVAL